MKGTKFDQDKPRHYAVMKGFARALQIIGDIGDHGGKKYEFENWLKVDVERYEDAMMRHLLAHMAGEETDPDSGYPHLGHVAWNICAILEKYERSKTTDTR